MPAKRSWPRIRLWHANAVLYVVIAVVAAVYWSDLRWGLEALPSYLDGDIPTPVERVLYRSAGRLVRESRDLDRAKAMIDRSLAIDPYGEAGFWLGRYYLRAGEEEEAVEAFESYLDVDPTDVRIYLKVADLHRKHGRMPEAREILERGLAYFERYADRYEPRLDEDVSSRYNDKAVDVFEQYAEAVRDLRARLADLEEGKSDSP